ncbi:MAG: hypothetical protein WAU78_00145 [Roseiarcus sp.]|jgi:hypothetical protein
MKSNDAVRWLRISYWAGAILDALAALSMLSPDLFAATNGLTDFRPGLEWRFAMGMGASLMLGWTALLLWADRKPLERKGVLVITVFPVVLGLALNEIVAVRAGFLSVLTTAPVWIAQAIVTGLLLFSYWNARKLNDP